LQNIEKGVEGEIPMLRLIHCIIEDDSTRWEFLGCYDIDSDRLAVENRNSVRNVLKLYGRWSAIIGTLLISILRQRA
jgi:hypothetical protein